MRYWPEHMNLRKLAQETLEVLERVAIEKEINLRNAIPGGIWIYADRNMIGTVLRNLTSNALKYTPRHGNVTVDALAAGNGQEVSPVSVLV